MPPVQVNVNRRAQPPLTFRQERIRDAEPRPIVVNVRQILYDDMVHVVYSRMSTNSINDNDVAALSQIPDVRTSALCAQFWNYEVYRWGIHFSDLMKNYLLRLVRRDGFSEFLAHAMYGDSFYEPWTPTTTPATMEWTPTMQQFVLKLITMLHRRRDIDEFVFMNLNRFLDLKTQRFYDVMRLLYPRNFPVPEGEGYIPPVGEVYPLLGD